jgi:hypothetical protein
VPLVVIALAISKLLKAVLSILIYVLDYAFPILLQLMRIPATYRPVDWRRHGVAFGGRAPVPTRVRCEARRMARTSDASSGFGSGVASATRPSSMRSTTPSKPEWRGCSENAEG